MTNAEKIEWLRGYQMAKLEVQRIQEELERWRSIAEKVTPVFSGTGRMSADGNRIEKAVEKIQEYRARMADTLAALVDRCAATEHVIDTVPDARLRLLLRYRYIDGLTFERTAEAMGISCKWVCRLHRRALEFLEVPY